MKALGITRRSWFSSARIGAGLIVYAASLAQVGKTAEAGRACIHLRGAKPDMTLASLKDLPFAKASDRDHVADSLRKAGLPEK